MLRENFLFLADSVGGREGGEGAATPTFFNDELAKKMASTSSQNHEMALITRLNIGLICTAPETKNNGIIILIVGAELAQPIGGVYPSVSISPGCGIKPWLGMVLGTHRLFFPLFTQILLFSTFSLSPSRLRQGAIPRLPSQDEDRGGLGYT